MTEKQLSFLLGLVLLFCPASLLAQVDENKRVQDSIAIVRAEQQLNGDTSSAVFTNASTTPVLDSASPFASIDSNKTLSKKHNAKKAALFSAVLPGLGQAYNRKYWKIPIVYAGFAGLSYAVYYTASNYNNARNAYRAVTDDDPNTTGIFQGTSNAATLKEYRDYHKRNLTISGVCMGLWYVLNVIDATVDAHLFDFNMSDKLTLHIQPAFTPTMGYYAQSGMSYGGQLNFVF